MNTKRNRKNLSGRPKGAKTRYEGINQFAAGIGVSHQFARAVLDGKATSRRVLLAWVRWQQGRAGH